MRVIPTVVILICLVLLGCTTQHQANDAAAAAERARAQDQADDAQCRAMGIQPGSDAFASCKDVLRKSHVGEEPR